MMMEINNNSIAYTRSGTGPPLIMLHGNHESKEIFDRLTDALRHHFEIIRYDQRCHGRSTCQGALTYELMALDLLLVMDHLAIKNPFLFGFSDGAITILEALHRRPHLSDLIALAGVNTSLRGLSAKTLQDIKASCRVNASPYDKLMLSQKALSKRFLRSIDASFLLLFGEHDVIRKGHIDMLQRTFKDQETEIIASATHDSYIIDCDCLAPILLSFFNKKRMSSDILEDSK